ncbi:MAG: SDR family oxidoreductase [Neisseria sp.]|nr:SDR family oxidoreductase [Neisseria sp.]
MSEKKLDGKVILITGASQGIGAEVAFAYAQEGATVVLLGRNRRKLEQVYDRITAQGLPEPYAISFDLLKAEEAEFNTLAEQIFSETKRLDGIVHCAAYFYALSPLEFQTIDEWVNQYRINAIAPFALTRAFLPLFKRNDDTSVIFVSESHSETPQAYWAGFGASKAALNYLCGSLADEYERFAGFRANVLIPGVVNSPQREKTHPGESSAERTPIAAILPDFVYWMSEASRGRSGEVVYLTANA